MAALETDMVCWIRIYDQHKCVNVIYILKFIAPGNKVYWNLYSFIPSMQEMI